MSERSERTIEPTSEQVLVVERPGVVSLRTEPSRGPLPEGSFDVQTRFSGLSAGTDLSWVKGTNPALHNHWDGELGLFHPGGAGSGYPIERFGYMQVGQVVASATPAVRAGDTVAMTYGHRSGYRADALTDRAVVLPGGLDPLLGIYAAHMGPICANGLLHAAAELHGGDVRSLADGVRGRRIVVTGAGVVGLLTALFAREHGAASVVLVDPTATRRHTAQRLGLDTLDPDAQDAAMTLKMRWRHGVADRGADVVFQCRGRPGSLALALRVLRPQGTVIDLAFYPGGTDDVRLGEEFHHNGLTVRCAQIGRVPRGLTHLWDRERLSAETITLLRDRGQDIVRHLVSDLVPLRDAPAVLTELSDGRRHALQVVFVGDDECLARFD